MKFLTVLPVIVALIAGIQLTSGFHVSFKANRRNTGFAKIAPWLQRSIDALSSSITSLASLGRLAWRFMLLRPHALGAAAVVLMLLLGCSGDGVSALGLVTGVTLQELEQDYNRAVSAHHDAVARGLDPKTVQLAQNKVLSIGGRVVQMRDDHNMRAEIDRLVGDMAPRRVGGVSSNSRSLGAQLVNSSAFKWVQEHRGKLPENFTTMVSELGAFGEMRNATISDDAASGGDLVLTDYQRGIVPMPTRPLVVADLMAPGTTESNTVGYMKEMTATNSAAPVAQGAPKPESALAFDAVTDPVRKIATWIPVTEEMLDDVASFRSYIDGRLRLFVQLAEDDQLLNGNGTAPNIEGVLSRSGLTAAYDRTGSETTADAILKQIGILEAAENLQVDGIVMHPTNWDNVLLLKDGDGRYIAGGGPFAAPQRKTLWGRDVAVTSAITLNTGLVGAFKTASQFFRKGGLRVDASNAHSDFFVRNLVAIRVESRGALAVFRESAFGKVTSLT